MKIYNYINKIPNTQKAFNNQEKQLLYKKINCNNLFTPYINGTNFKNDIFS